MKSCSGNSEPTVASSNPQSIGGVLSLVQRLRDAGEQNMGEAWNRNDIHSLGLGANLVEEAASTIEHQLSVIGEMRDALNTIVANTEPDALKHRDYDHLAKDICDCASTALSHPIIGDKS